jgi:DNA replication protein DnaC
MGEIKLSLKDTISHFLQTEKEYRKQYKIKRLLKMSGIKQVKTFKQFDWRFNPKIPKNEILEYLHSPWIEQPANLVLIGDTGLGKSHIASSLCYEAIMEGNTTCFITAFDLASKIKKAINSSTKIDYYAKIRVLCIDELGYTYHKKEDTDIIFQIISKRNEILPTIVTTNLSPKEWGSIFSGPAASAILDRLSFNGKFLTLEGSSYRLLKKRKAK